jgi:hypothetical protein
MAMYSELVYFEGAHFAHIAAYAEHQRISLTRSRATAHGERQRRQPTQPSPTASRTPL